MNQALLHSLSGMEAQAREVEGWNARLRSIQESADRLKAEQSRLKEPPEPTPEDLSNTFVARVAKWGGVVIFAFTFLTLLSLSSLTTLGNFLLFGVISFATGWLIEKIAAIIAEEREKQSKERLEAARQQWEADKARYLSRKEQIPKHLLKLSADAQAATQAKQQAEAQLAARGQKVGLHSDYWSLYALSHIRSLLEHGRADTLKEAINRYEEEQRQLEMSYHANEQTRYAREQAQAAQRTADAAEYQAERLAAIRQDVSEMERRQRQQ